MATTVVLLRHGRSTANVAGVLSGRTPGVGLDDEGRRQAAAVAGRLSSVTFDRIVSSPLQRCQETVAPLTEATGLPVVLDDRFAEVDYGQWSGRKLNELFKEDLWRVVQGRPSAAYFPGGEGIADASSRAVAGVRAVIAEVTADKGEDAVVLICSHGDVIKAILADALGLHLDGFQRIVVGPASLSVIRYTDLRPFVERVNDSGELGTLRPPPETKSAEPVQTNEPAEPKGPDESDAVPGGATGTD